MEREIIKIITLNTGFISEFKIIKESEQNEENKLMLDSKNGKFAPISVGVLCEEALGVEILIAKDLVLYHLDTVVNSLNTLCRRIMFEYASKDTDIVTTVKDSFVNVYGKLKKYVMDNGMSSLETIAQIPDLINETINVHNRLLGIKSHPYRHQKDKETKQELTVSRFIINLDNSVAMLGEVTLYEAISEGLANVFDLVRNRDNSKVKVYVDTKIINGSALVITPHTEEEFENVIKELVNESNILLDKEDDNKELVRIHSSLMMLIKNVYKHFNDRIKNKIDINHYLDLVDRNYWKIIHQPIISEPMSFSTVLEEIKNNKVQKEYTRLEYYNPNDLFITTVKYHEYEDPFTGKPILHLTKRTMNTKTMRYVEAAPYQICVQDLLADDWVSITRRKDLL